MSSRLYRPANNWFCLLTSFLLMLPITFYITGCASYVNIPADGRDTAINAVNLPPVPAVMSEALGYATAKFPMKSAYHFSLPPNANERTYRLAKENITAYSGEEASFPEPDSHYDGISKPQYQVISVRIRGNHASVNVLLPKSLADRRLLIIGLSGGISGWKVISLQQYYPNATDLVQAANQFMPQTDMKSADEELEQDVIEDDKAGIDSDSDSDFDATLEIGEAVDMTEVLEEPKKDTDEEEINIDNVASESEKSGEDIPESSIDKPVEDPLKPIVVEEDK